jgi:pSer/pThr/pTyr-binding forkhead associated (FHA) protein
MIAQLIPENGGEPISIDRDVVVLGRQEEGCDVTIEHKSVSKIHCVIVKTDGLLFVRDLLSTNGTRVNGQRVTRAALLPGDVLAVAHARFRVHLGPSSANPAPGATNATQAMVSMNPAKPSPAPHSADEALLHPRSGHENSARKKLPERD